MSKKSQQRESQRQVFAALNFTVGVVAWGLAIFLAYRLGIFHGINSSVNILFGVS